MANFVSNDNATSLMNAINQKKDSKPSTITWAEWIALTDEQREGTHYIITNVPAKFSDKDAVFSIKDQTLTFTNKTATVTDSRITADTYIFTFYHNQAVAQASGIECSWTTGTVTFTVDENPSEDIVVDILCILPALATPPSEGGGHVIEDASGTDLPQEDTMQFADARVEDDSTNGKTVVHVTQEPMTVSEFNAAEDLNPGIYPLNGGEVLDDSMIMHDSTHTTRQAIDEVVGKVAFATYNIPNDTSEHTFSCPTGFTADNSCLIGANCNTRYNSKVDYTYDNFSYWGDFRYNRLNTSEFVFAPKIAGNSTSITFIFMKQ